MAGGVAASELISRVRAEAWHSVNVAQGVHTKASILQMLNRVQEELAITHDWPGLYISRDVSLADAQKTYSFPADLDFDYTQRAWVAVGSEWQRIGYGIGPIEYSIYDSDAGEKSWPVRRWMLDADTPTQFEVWPIPSQTGTLQLWGRKLISRMVNDADTCVLDATVLVLMVAGEILAKQKSEDAATKIGKARDLIRHLNRRQGADKQRPFILGGGMPEQRQARPRLRYVPPS